MSVHDLEHEPIPGLPEELPEGETILWQGRPDWKLLARHAFKWRWLAVYFTAMVALRAVFAMAQGEGAEGFTQVLAMSGVFAGCLGLVALMAWLNAKATVYTITSRRVVMRIGVALSMSWNLPFKRLTSADLALRSDRDGDVVLQVAEPVRWLYFWPHVHRFLRARPVLRGLNEPERVARVLRDAVGGWATKTSTQVEVAEMGAAEARPAAPMTPELAAAGR